MTRIFFIIFLFLFGSLTGCTSLSPPAVKENANIAWDNRLEDLAALKNWNVKGQVAIRSKQDSVSASLKWQQKQENYTILMWGPLGSYSYELNGQPGKVELITAEGKHFSASNPEALLAKQVGWQVPVSSLYYWIRGIPVPSVSAVKKWDAQHHLILLKQQGWTVQYLNYTSVNRLDLPSKILLTNPQWTVKVFISQWQVS